MFSRFEVLTGHKVCQYGGVTGVMVPDLRDDHLVHLGERAGSGNAVYIRLRLCGAWANCWAVGRLLLHRDSDRDVAEASAHRKSGEFRTRPVGVGVPGVLGR